jgi:two-component system, NarL family, response regulator DesR
MIRIVIAEDQRMLRGALGNLLNLEEDITVVGEAANGEEALSLIRQLQPDVCLLDIEMPVKSGLEVAEAIKNERLPCKVMILTTFARPGYFERAVRAGVHGYVLKDSPVEQLADAIRNIMTGKKEVSPELAFGFVQTENPLTNREQDVLRLVKEGKTTKEIAATLYLSSGTVRNYMSEILAKLEVKNRIEAITVAEKNGWI